MELNEELKNLCLSATDLLATVKQFVEPGKHDQLDDMLQRYMQKKIGKQQASMRLATAPTAPAATARVFLLPELPSLLCESSTSPPLSELPRSFHGAQFQLELRVVAGREALQSALLAMVPQIEELQNKRELLKLKEDAKKSIQQAQHQYKMTFGTDPLTSDDCDDGLSSARPSTPAKGPAKRPALLQNTPHHRRTRRSQTTQQSRRPGHISP